MSASQRITPFLWFDGCAEHAAQHYVSIFDDAKILRTTRYNAAGPGPEGAVMVVEFALAGQEFVALNGGPQFPFTEAISLVVNCETQEEVDRYWARLAEGGQEGPCGWLKDRFGVSWQVVPIALTRMMQDADPEKARRATEAMLQMKKLDLARLERAYRAS
jgi:predicted 3-demethylubiquinone-9 3-methyltransferase (glyoxalase superfamily)